MKTFVATRLGAMVAILVALTAVMFLLQHISPLDPVQGAAGRAGVGSRRWPRGARHSGSTSRLLVQFWHYLTAAVTGDLGTSYRTRHPVASDLGDFFPATLELALYGIAIALVLAVMLAFSTTLKWRGAGVLRAVLFTGRVGADVPARHPRTDRLLPEAGLGSGQRAHRDRRTHRPGRPAC